jgi:hypothetical protein
MEHPLVIQAFSTVSLFFIRFADQRVMLVQYVHQRPATRSRWHWQWASVPRRRVLAVPPLVAGRATRRSVPLAEEAIRERTSKEARALERENENGAVHAPSIPRIWLRRLSDLSVSISCSFIRPISALRGSSSVRTRPGNLVRISVHSCARRQRPSHAVVG